MEQSVVRVKVSPKQISKLRNGHRVRIKPPTMEGEGICMIVNPANYDIINRTFSRSKGLEIALSPQEIVANQEVAPQMEGQGIFGKKFDRGVKKVIGKRAAKELYSELGNYLPMAQAGLIGGLATAGTALGVVQPELIPFIAPGVAALSTMGSNYLANPSRYQSNAGGSKAKLASSLAGRMLQDQALQRINAETGANLGSLDRASIQQALANKASGEMNKMAVQQKQSLDSYYGSMFDGIEGNGLYAGAPMRGGSMRRCGGAVGLNSSMVNTQSPALRSQPFSANFQFQHTLPPNFQRFSRGSGLSL